MASVTYVPQTTVITTNWIQPVNDWTYKGTVASGANTGTDNQILITSPIGAVEWSSSLPTSISGSFQPLNATLTSISTNNITGTSSQIDISATYQISIDSAYPASLILAESQITGLTSALAALQPLNGNLTAVAAISTNGFLQRTGVNTWSTVNATISSGASVSGSNTGDQTITLTGNVTGSGSGSFPTTIANSAVTYAMIQNVTSNSVLLGAGSAGTGLPPSQISVGSGLSMSGTTLSATPGTPANYPNYLYNSQGSLYQRIGTAGTAVTNNNYGADRWKVLTQTASITVGQSTGNVTSNSSQLLTQSQASAQRFGIIQFLESVDGAFANQTVTFSFAIKSSSTPVVLAHILAWTSTADSPTTNVVNSWTSTTYTAGNFYIANIVPYPASPVSTTCSSSYQTVTVTGTVGATCNNIAVFLWTTATVAQSVTIQVTDCQLVIGSAAPTYYPNKYSDEIVRCQRYYEKSFDINTAPVQNLGKNTGEYIFVQASALSVQSCFCITYSTQKRAYPGLPTTYSPAAATAQPYDEITNSACTAITAFTANQKNASFTYTNAAGTAVGNAIGIHWSVDIDF